MDLRTGVGHRAFIGNRPPGRESGKECAGLFFLVSANNPQGVDDTREVLERAVSLVHAGFMEESMKLTPRIVKRMLIRRSEPHPRSRKTPSGGRMTAKIILQISLGEMSEQTGPEGAGGLRRVF